MAVTDQIYLKLRDETEIAWQKQFELSRISVLFLTVAIFEAKRTTTQAINMRLPATGYIVVDLQLEQHVIDAALQWVQERKKATFKQILKDPVKSLRDTHHSQSAFLSTRAALLAF